MPPRPTPPVASTVRLRRENRRKDDMRLHFIDAASGGDGGEYTNGEPRSKFPRTGVAVFGVGQKRVL